MHPGTQKQKRHADQTVAIFKVTTNLLSSQSGRARTRKLIQKMKTSRKAIGQILKEKGFITQEQLDNALKQQKMLSARLGDVIIKMGFAHPDQITNCLAEQFDYKVVDPLAITIPDDVINITTREIVKKYNIMPIARQNGLLIVATSDPLDIQTQENLRFILNYDIECVLATSDNIEKAIKKYYDKYLSLSSSF